MRFQKTLQSAIAFSVLAVFTTIGSAQQPPAPQGQPQQGERQRSEEATLTGCLIKGSADGQYILTDTAGTKTSVTPAAGVELDKHAANHTVKLTGSNAGGKFTASKVEHVSATCDSK